jgi:hypothetical protein
MLLTNDGTALRQSQGPICDDRRLPQRVDFQQLWWSSPVLIPFVELDGVWDFKLFLR